MNMKQHYSSIAYLILCIIIPCATSFTHEPLFLSRIVTRSTSNPRKPSFAQVQQPSRTSSVVSPRKKSSSSSLKQSENNSESDFSFAQRIESGKTLVVGLLAGGIALTPFSALHDIFLGGDSVRNGLAQWEFDTDMGSIEAGLFAIVYRYCVS